MSKGGSDYTPGRTRVSKFSVGTGSYPGTEGSTRFGNTTDDLHEFTGSVMITGSLWVSGSLYFSGSLSGAIENIPSSTNNAIVRWDGNDGERVQDSKVIIDDSGYVIVPSGSQFGSGGENSYYHQFTGSIMLYDPLQKTFPLLTSTTGCHHYYAIGPGSGDTQGSDLNNGLSWATAKQSLGSIFSIIPKYIRWNDHVCVHLSGTFNEGGWTTAQNTSSINVITEQSGSLYAANSLVIDGGEKTVVIADNAGSPWTADIFTTTTIGLTTLTWTPDQYAGYWVELVSATPSTLVPQIRTIMSHTETTITMNAPFSSAPTAATFRIVRPETTLSCAQYSYYTVGYISINNGGSGQVCFQNLYLSGGLITQGLNNLQNFGSLMRYSSIVSDQTTLSHFTGYVGIYCTFGYVNTSSFADVSNTSYRLSSVSLRKDIITLSPNVLSRLYATDLYTNDLIINDLPNINMASCRHKSLTLVNCNSYHSGSVSMRFSNYGSSHITYKITGSTTDGVTLRNSTAELRGIDISKCTRNAIVADNSNLYFGTVAVTGTENGGWACLAKNNSQINTRFGGASNPTVSGSLGYISTDNTTQLCSWTDLTSNDFVDIGQTTRIGEYDNFRAVKTVLKNGNMYLSGNLEVSSSTKFGYDSTKIHQFTGSVFLPTTYAGITTINPQLIVTGTANLPQTYIADLEVSGSTKFGYDPTKIHQFTGSSFNVFGNVYLENSVASQSISPYGGAFVTKHWSEIVQLNTPNTLYNTSYQIPAGAVCYGVGIRILGSFVTASGHLAIGIAGVSDKWGGSMGTTAGITNATSSMASGFEYFSAASSIQLSASKAQGIEAGGIATGSVRVEAFYNELIPPQR